MGVNTEDGADDQLLGEAMKLQPAQYNKYMNWDFDALSFKMDKSCFPTLSLSKQLIIEENTSKFYSSYSSFIFYMIGFILCNDDKILRSRNFILFLNHSIRSNFYFD